MLLAAVSPSGALTLIELGAVVTLLALASRAAARLSVSPIPLYLLAGMGIGAGWLPIAPNQQFVETGSLIGVVLLLLALGLEYSAVELSNRLRTGWIDGLVDFVGNATPGFLAGLLLGWSTVASILLGGVTWVSSSGVVAKTLSDLGRLGNRETPVVLSVLVLEDLGMAVYLPVMGTLLAGAGLIEGLAAVGVAIGVLALVLVAALRSGHVVTRAMSARTTEGLLLTVFGLTLLVAGIAEYARVSAAVGAFLLGTAITGVIAHEARTAIMPLRDLFAAIFFLFFGMQIDIAALAPAALPAVALAAITVLTKYGTASWTARRAGIGRAGIRRAGTLLAARGEFSIVIAGLGAALEPELAPLAAGYVLATVVIGPLLTRWVDSTDKPPARLEPDVHELTPSSAAA